MLAAQDVSVAYGKTTVLKAVSVAFRPGRMTALVGPNGCGKSTLLKAVMGFVPLTGGGITLEGTPTHKIPRRSFARRMAYLPQESYCPDYLTLGELIELAGYARYSLLSGPSDRDRQLFRAALEIVGLTDLVHRQVNSLSGGQRQRAWIAMVLAQDSGIVLMDEPVNHIDVKFQYSVLEIVRNLTIRHGKTVIAVLHDLNLTTAFADEVVMLRDGEVVASGAVSETINSASVERVFDLEADIFTRNGRLVCLPHMTNASPVSV